MTAALHHRDAIADLRRHAQIMGNEQHRQAEPRFEVFKQVQNLRLHRHIERRDGFVGDQDFRLERQRAGDADALPLAAGEFVRIALHGAGVQTDQAQKLAGTPARDIADPCRARSGRRR